MYVNLTNIDTVLDQLDCMYYCFNRASQYVDGQIEVCSSGCDVCFVCFQEKGPVTNTKVRELLALVCCPFTDDSSTANGLNKWKVQWVSYTLM